ncbi:uncharacterized protein LOC118766812 [Octopus sinensis]|uniref:Uncharacterized protein LOC118766812 n=1 Tax=Octopus sinensis TaxID=2607531 RepID=A0A7E6FFI1_9MOLL|nr:uncharacterized protein LOC118766812 [Octopus sinensis]
MLPNETPPRCPSVVLPRDLSLKISRSGSARSRQQCPISTSSKWPAGPAHSRPWRSTFADELIHTSQALAQRGSGNVTWALTSQTFLNVVKDLGIPCVAGDFESDSQIMLLANQWNCPVLSNESDFYIYDVTGGFIIQVIYGILLFDNVDKESRKESFIEEYDRVGCNYKKKKVNPVFTIPDFGPLPSLSDILSATLDIKHIILLTLGSDLEFLKEFPEELKIVAITIVYWVKNANHEIHKAMVTVLVLCNIYIWVKISKDKTEKQSISSKLCWK